MSDEKEYGGMRVADGAEASVRTDAGEQAGESLDADEPERLTGGYFEGDTGQLDYDVRCALTSLLKNRYIASRGDAETWRTVTENEDLLRSRLNDLFLELTVDRRYEVAFAEQASPETGSFPNVLKPVRQLRREETLLLIYLRAFYHKQISSGATDVFVGKDELMDYLSQLDSPDDVNHAETQRQREKAIEDFTSRHGYLILIPSQPDRFRVSPIVAAILPLERVKALKVQFGIAADVDPADPADPDPADPAPADPGAYPDDEENPNDAD